MIVKIINTDLKGRIRKDDELKLALAKANKVKVDTVNRWLREDDMILTTATNLELISKHFNLSEQDEMLQEKELLQQD
jgi:MOSC domain-containing protein YiiM